jgi:hypothetical protein
MNTESEQAFGDNEEYVSNVKRAMSDEVIKFLMEEDRVLREMGLERHPLDGDENQQLKNLDFLVVRRSLLSLAMHQIEHNPDTAAEAMKYLSKDSDGTARIRLTLPRVVFFTPPRYRTCISANCRRAHGHMKGDVYLDTGE